MVSEGTSGIKHKRIYVCAIEGLNRGAVLKMQRKNTFLIQMMMMGGIKVRYKLLHWYYSSNNFFKTNPFSKLILQK